MAELPFRVHDVVRVIACPTNKAHVGARGFIFQIADTGAVGIALENGQWCFSQTIERATTQSAKPTN